MNSTLSGSAMAAISLIESSATSPSRRPPIMDQDAAGVFLGRPTLRFGATAIAAAGAARLAVVLDAAGAARGAGAAFGALTVLVALGAAVAALAAGLRPPTPNPKLLAIAERVAL